jgi:hypothetical protein
MKRKQFHLSLCAFLILITFAVLKKSQAQTPLRQYWRFEMVGKVMVCNCPNYPIQPNCIF